ncbi:MAG: 50S ribosomal protein L16 [Candidatus Dojkabacteria bacterium]|nr:50S ribosomal protein L16 [Candidatus Dojkabacteria bacterium]
MLQPKKRKHKKEFRGKMRGISLKGSTLAYGDFGLQAVDRGWITSRQLEAARKVIVKHTKRKGKTWLKVFPHKPVTAKSSEVKRGGGKGEIDRYVAVIKPGRVIFELGGLTEEVAKHALKLAAQKFPLKLRVISK